MLPTFHLPSSVVFHQQAERFLQTNPPAYSGASPVSLSGSEWAKRAWPPRPTASPPGSSSARVRFANIPCKQPSLPGSVLSAYNGLRFLSRAMKFSTKLPRMETFVLRTFQHTGRLEPTPGSLLVGAQGEETFQLGAGVRGQPSAMGPEGGRGLGTGRRFSAWPQEPPPQVQWNCAASSPGDA